jgi:hypothetical protein
LGTDPGVKSACRALSAVVAAIYLTALAPASASAAASAWKLVSVRGEVRLHVEDSHASIPCEEASRPWVATGDYRNVLTSKTAIFGRGHGVYNGVFGTIIGGFQVDFRLHREATERVNVTRTITDPVTETETCTVEERTCTGSSEKRSKGSSGLGFSPQRRRGRLGPVRVGFSGHWKLHSCDRGAEDPIQNLEFKRGQQFPSVKAILPLSRFRPARMRIVMAGSTPMRDPFRAGDVSATLTWRFVWKLRRTVVGWEGCLEQGRPSGFVCEVVG